jgi:hypothetical protein
MIEKEHKKIFNQTAKQIKKYLLKHDNLPLGDEGRKIMVEIVLKELIKADERKIKKHIKDCENLPS